MIKITKVLNEQMTTIIIVSVVHSVIQYIVTINKNNSR